MLRTGRRRVQTGLFLFGQVLRDGRKNAGHDGNWIDAVAAVRIILPLRTNRLDDVSAA